MPGSLNPFDLFVMIVLVVSTFWGGMRGVVSQITSIFSWLASAYIATHYYGVVAKFMNASYSYQKQLAMIVTFIVSALLIRIASNMIKDFISLAGLKEFDRQMGALFGLIKGLLLCLLVTFLLVVAGDTTRAMIEKSNTGPYFASFMSSIQEQLPESELTRKFIAYTDSIKEETIENSEDDGTETKSISTEVRDLKKYLVEKVLSDQASDIVAEAEETEEDPTDLSVSSLLKTASSSVNKLKSALSGNGTTSGTSAAESTNANSSWGNTGSNVSNKSSVYDDYGYDDGYGRNDRSDSAVSSEYSDPGWNTTRSTSYDSDGYGEVDDYQSNSYNSAASTAQNQSSGVDRALGGLDSFLSTIGGGFGDYSRSSASTPRRNSSSDSGYESSGNYDSEQTDGSYYQPSTRSSSYGVSSSRSRLNSRTYTIDQTAIGY